MKIIIPGGSGQVGNSLAREFTKRGDQVVILSRTTKSAKYPTVAWDARTLGSWTAEIDGADVVINLAGKTVNCRYSAANRREIIDSRVESTRIIGQAIAAATNPPRVWLQASTATIYAHRYDKSNNEYTGIIGGDEPNAPDTWRFSIAVAKAWEAALAEIPTPRTRKVAMRTAMTMTPDRGGIFDVLSKLCRRWLGGTAGDGKQYVSWIHERDFLNAVHFLIRREHLVGVVNIASPNALPNREFMQQLREALGVKIRLAGNALDARNRRVLHAHRNGVDPKKPTRGTVASWASGVRVSVPGMARGRGRPSEASSSGLIDLEICFLLTQEVCCPTQQDQS